MQVLAVVEVFHILKGMKGNDSKHEIAPVFLRPTPFGFAWLSGFVCLCRTLGKGSVRILY